MRRSLRPALWLATLTVVLGLVLAACNSATGTDTTPPTLSITSSATANGTTYDLTGTATDNVAATRITYTVDGGPTQTLNLTNTSFSINVTLQSGANTIVVHAFDAAGNETTDTFTVTYSPPPPPPTSGSLTVNISGLPSGTAANVVVTGPSGYNQVVTASQTLTNLVAGTYTITPSDVTVNLTDYKGTATPASVSVTNGNTSTSAVTYVATYGFLDVTVTGLPSGVAAAISVAGPGNYSQSVTSTTTLSALNPGSYTVTASTVTDSATNDVYTATVSGSPASVTAGAHSSVTVTYARTTDHLTINISGLTGINANVTITGPNAPGGVITATTTLTGLQDGSYTIFANPVTSGSTTYDPNQAQQSVSLSGGQSSSVNIVYSIPSPTTGSLAITIAGLPSGTSGYVNVTGPVGTAGSSTQTVTSSTTLSNLAPGSYNIVPVDVSGPQYDYSGTAVPSSVTITAGGTKSSAVTYHATDGSLTLTVQGLPANTMAGVNVTGPAGTIAFNATNTIDHLAPGTYTIATKQVTGSNGELYADSADNNTTVTVTAGNPTTKTLTFAQVSGDLTVTIVGVTNGNVAISDNASYTQQVTQTTTLKGLYATASGSSYSVTPNNVLANGYHWTGAATQGGNPVSSVIVNRGQTSTVTVTYTATDGAIAVNITGLPAGLAAAVQVVDPTGNVAFGPSTQSGTIDYVPAGTYNVVVTSVKDSNFSYAFVPYQGDPYTFQVTVTNGNTAQAAVTYGAVTGILDVTVNGITDGGTPDVTVAGTSTSYPITSSGLTVLKYIGADTYTTTANNITGSLFHYTASPASQSLHVGQGQTKSETVTYVASDGAMQITFSGPHPSLSSYDAAVTGPGGTSFTLTTSSANVPVTKSYLPQGSYTVTPDPYTSNSCPSGATVTKYKYTMSPSSPSVTNGQTESISVVYSTFQFQCP